MMKKKLQNEEIITANSFTETLEKLQTANLHLEQSLKKHNEVIIQISNFRKALLDNAALAIITSDTDGLIQTFNPAAEQMLGYKTNEVVGKYRFEQFHDKEELTQKYNEQTDTGSNEEFEMDAAVFQCLLQKITEWTYVRKNGEKFPVKISHSPIVHSDGTTLGFIAIIMDNTDEKRAITTLMQREAYLSAIIENQPGIVWLKDTESRFLATNEAFARSCGAQSKEHLVGKTDLDIWPADLAKMYREDDFRVMKSGKPYKVEEPVYDKGEKKWFETFKTPVFNVNGEIIGTSGYAIDITERKRAEAEIVHQAGLITSLLDSIPDIIFFKDLNGIYLGCNPQFAEFVGKPKSDIIGKSDYDLFPKEIADFFRFHDNKMLADKTPQHNEEWITYPDGRKKLIDTLKTPYRQADGKLIGVLGVSRDITERKKAEEEILKAKTEAENANKAKSEFLSRMSHELRTPLNSILGFAQLLDMGELNQIHKKGVKHILKSGAHLLNLINEVLDISRIEAGKFSISIEPVQVRGIINEIVDVVKPFADKKRVSIAMGGCFANEKYIMADRQRAKQVLINLINNAIKYNHDGGSVAIKTDIRKDAQKDAETIRISITDTGTGISDEDLKKIFVPFERIGADKTSIEGTGLGLAVVSKLIGAMKGNIGVDSTVGKGSTFWIEFPAYQGDSPSSPGQVLPANPPENLIQKKGTILYIEDNLANFELIDQILFSQYQGIKLISTTQGAQALTIAKEYHPDLVLLDLNLPDIHGTEVFKILQENEITKNIPVIIISADAMPRHIESLLKAGVKGYLTKPLDLQNFLKVINTFIF